MIISAYKQGVTKELDLIQTPWSYSLIFINKAC